MERRIEELAADYVSDVLAATSTLTDRVLANVARLARDVLADGRRLVATATDGLFTDDAA